MAQQTTVSGAMIKVYLNGSVYSPCEQVSWNISYEENEIFGIDSSWAQAIEPGKVSVSGSISGLVLQMDGGLQGSGVRPLLKDAVMSPYISIRIQDRVNQIDLLNINDAKVSNESVNISAKGLVRVSFSFKGIYPSQTLDMA